MKVDFKHLRAIQRITRKEELAFGSIDHFGSTESGYPVAAGQSHLRRRTIDNQLDH
jgi:hypothetical protein